MILFIDDEPRQTQVYREALGLDFKRTVRNYANIIPEDITSLEFNKTDIIYLDAVDVAHDIMMARIDSIELIILDIMMASGQKFGLEETEYGLSTGIVLLEKLREQPEGKSIPVIVLTNVYDPKAAEELRKDLHCDVIQKEHLMPDKLSSEVKKHLEKAHNGEG